MMKKIICIAFVGLFFMGCKNEPRTDYIINGTAKGVFNGIRVYLNTMDERGRMTPVDTALVMNEEFTLDGAVEYPSLHYITVNGVPGRQGFIIENKKLKLNINNKILSNSELLGSKHNDVYTNFNTDLNELKNDLIKASNDYDKAKFLKDSTNIPNYKKLVDELKEKFESFPIEYIEKNKNSYGILPIINTQLNSRGLNPEKFLELFKKIDENIKNTQEGKKLEEKIKIIRMQLEAEKATAIGAIAPDFSAPTSDEETLALSEVVSKGKITMIDFWAAWCGPCRRENPNIVKIYEEYHDKGLEIIGVGLDGRRGQKNPKEAWINAIEKDKLNWHQVSNLRYFDEIAQLYNVRSIPSMFILDNKGEIIAKNLRGRALEKKISDLLD